MFDPPSILHHDITDIRERDAVGELWLDVETMCSCVCGDRTGYVNPKCYLFLTRAPRLNQTISTGILQRDKKTTMTTRDTKPHADIMIAWPRSYQWFSVSFSRCLALCEEAWGALNISLFHDSHGAVELHSIRSHAGIHCLLIPNEFGWFTGVGEVKRLLEVHFQRSDSCVCYEATLQSKGVMSDDQQDKPSVHMEKDLRIPRSRRRDDALHPLQPIVGQTSCLPHFLLQQAAASTPSVPHPPSCTTSPSHQTYTSRQVVCAQAWVSVYIWTQEQAELRLLCPSPCVSDQPLIGWWPFKIKLDSPIFGVLGS